MLSSHLKGLAGLCALALGLASSQGLAQDKDSLSIATDIQPVQALVTMVVGNAHQTSVLVNPDSSPHHHALRPSQVRLLAKADIVIHVGETLTPWISSSLQRVAPQTSAITLLGASSDKEHDEHADHHDPHAWLDPSQAIEWLLVIRDAVTQIAPADSDLFRRNTERAVALLEQRIKTIEERSAELSQRRWLIYHNSLGEFSERFGIHPVDTVSDMHDAPPSAAHLSEVRAHIAEGHVDCVLAEAGTSDRALKALSDSGTLNIIPIDPLGASLPMDEHFYVKLLDAVVDAVDACV